MDDEKTAAILASVDELKSKGVTGIKLELEAQFGRGNFRPGGPHDCDDGEVRCTACDGEDCEECNYSGWMDCPTCEQASNEYDFRNDSECFRFLMDTIAKKTGTKLSTTSYSNELTKPFTWMTFARFYNDGSVDSELTFTIPIKDSKNVLKLPAVIEAFKELGEAIGSVFNVSGAGMHTALLFSKDCSYPHPEDDHAKGMRVEVGGWGSYIRVSHRLPTSKLNNFKRAVTQLLPALYFMGSTNENSRPLRYRLPHVSISPDDYIGGRGNKYSAVTYRMGAIEYRLFETCYDNPEAIFDIVTVIANTTKYLTTRYVSPQVTMTADVSSLMFGNDSSDKLERFYMEERMIDVLEAGIERLKPSWYTVQEIKDQRNFKRTKAELADLSSLFRKQADDAYDEYSERFDWSIRTESLRLKARMIERLIGELPPSELRQLTPDDMDARVEAEFSDRLSDLRSGKQDKDGFVSQHVRSRMDSGVGQYELRFN